MKRLVLSALLLAGALSGCGGDNGNDSVGQPSPTHSPSAKPVVSACPSGAPTTDLTKKPAPVLPTGSTPPATTTSTDVVVGKGALAKPGASVKVKYVGVLFATCEEFDSSWKVSPSYAIGFMLDPMKVVKGFATGTAGMRVGGRRQIVIPATEGYGDEGRPPVIPGGAALVFVIDLVSVT